MDGGKLIPRPNKLVCRLSEPANPHNLCRRSDPPLSVCFSCKGKHLEEKRYYYYCATCDLEFHRGCHIFSTEIRHPFHLIHPLSITFLDPDFQIPDIPINWDARSSDSDDTLFEDPGNSISDGNHVKCNSCRKNLRNEGEEAYYHCSTCNFSIHLMCAMIRPPLAIENLKTHDHALTLFPRQVPLPCNACGFSLEVTLDHVYICLLCNYMVHRSCIYLPRVIKITRHPHRLSYTSSLVPSSCELSCGVCRKAVDVNYGNYSCSKGCPYAVHSQCASATQDKVWDGIDLEGVPEEEEQVIDPFVRIDEETIQHFTHDYHPLKIHENDNLGNHENKFCEACILPITVSDRFYSCMGCEFVLHETCASLPRIKHHPIHKHPLTLFHPFSSYPPEFLRTEYSRSGFFRCDGCDRYCCGFMYKCTEEHCDFHLDARCASLLDPSFHDCHDHPLFFNLTKGECMHCKRSPPYSLLECVQCNSFLCLECATLPSVAHYKHDKHPFTLCCGEEKTTDLQYWCEICEGKLDATEWFYKCNSYSVTLHVECLLGEEMYMRPNHNIWHLRLGSTIDVSRNSGNSRPVCYGCKRRCIYALVFRRIDGIFCKVSCLGPGLITMEIARHAT